MAYTTVIDLHSGPTRAGLTVAAQFLNSNHTVNGGGSAVVTDVGSGDYEILCTIPAAFTGWIRFTAAAGATWLGTLAINPQEQENADVKTSTVGAGSALTALQVENAVWDAAKASHTIVGSESAALQSIGDPLASRVPGNYAANSAGYLLGQLRYSQVNFVSPITAGGVIHLIQGMAYLAEHGSALTWTLPNTTGDLTGAAGTLDWGGTVIGTVTFTGTVPAQIATLELTSPQSAALLLAAGVVWEIDAVYADDSDRTVLLTGTGSVAARA